MVDKILFQMVQGVPDKNEGIEWPLPDQEDMMCVVRGALDDFNALERLGSELLVKTG